VGARPRRPTEDGAGGRRLALLPGLQADAVMIFAPAICVVPTCCIAVPGTV
jgi:hypothetical protein